MDINDILADLGLDLTNPEVKRGAIEAIDAILTSRIPPMSIGGGGGQSGSMDVEIDPDLIRPSQKHQAPMSSDEIEVDDEEHLLDKVKHNESDIDSTGNSTGTDSDADTDASSSSSSSDSGDDFSGDSADASSDTDTSVSDGSDTDELESTDDSTDEDSTASSAKKGDLEDDEEGGSTEDTAADDDLTGDEVGEDPEGDADGATPGDSDSIDGDDDEFNPDDTDADDLEDEDLLDDNLKGTYDSQELKSKHEARRIKRERTLQAAKKALADAKAKKVSNSLIHELESAIASLEELTEAVKSIKDISDDEFNQRINRVFDAIDAVGDKSLTFTSDEERELQAQEIKTDLASSRTQAELSAEDVAQIRAENQAIKSREAEANKYKARARSSFKGFQDFLNSLYRAIALQVHVEETRDDTWSAINRRHSGSGVLQPGQRVQELNNKKIPVIDFYFDCSGSWGPADIAIGKEAVKKLAEMEEEGKIKINLYYFANHVHSDFESAEAEGGTRAWNDIVRNVISTQATNVIIMTDSDMEDWWDDHSKPPLRYTVPGYVWYLWRDGDNAPRLPRDLKGRGGVQQFSFSRGDA